MTRSRIIPVLIGILLIAVLGAGYTHFTEAVKGSTPDVLVEQRSIYSKLSPPGEPVLQDIVYRNGLFGKQALDIYLPLAGNDTGSLDARGVPTVIFVHGGSWLHGRKEDIRVIHRFLDKMRRHGWAVISIDYVASPPGLLNAPEHNVDVALRWIKNHAGDYGLDPERMGLYSVSAGSHLVMCALNKQENPRSAWRFWLNEYGPVNLVAMAGGEAFSNSNRLSLIPEFYLRRHSPALHIDEALPPTILVHGDADRTVAPEQSSRLAERLREAGTEVTLRIIPGGDHGFFNLPQSDWEAMENEFLPMMEHYFR